MPAYTYLAADPLTGTIRDEIPFSAVTYSSELNKPGGFDGTVNLAPKSNPWWLDDPATYTPPAKVTLANLAPARTIMWVLRDSVPVWGGFIWAFDADLDARQVRFGGQDFLSYYARRLINATQSFTQTEQFSIVDSLITYAKAQTGGNIGTTVTYSAASGQLRDRTYYGYEHKPILEAITQLAAVDGGFDFACDYTGSQAAGLGHTLRLDYPRRGRNTGIVFDTMKNCELLGWSQSGLSFATTMWAQGAGDGDAALTTSASDPSYLSTYPLLEDIGMYTSVTEQATLVGHAKQDLKLASAKAEQVQVGLRPSDSDAGVGSFIVGDTVRCLAKSGFIDINTLMRVMTRSVSVDENGQETLTAALTALEGTV